MSCFMMTARSIHALAVWAGDCARGRMPDCLAEANATGATLWAANRAAVLERYEGRYGEVGDYEPMTDRQFADLVALSPRNILAVHACYEYQSCDWSGFPGSTAERHGRIALYNACARLTEGPRNLPEYA